MAKTPRERRPRRADEEEPEQAAARPEPEEPQGKRLGIQVGADGRIEWDRLRDRTREELKIMLADPRLAEELGTAPRVDSAGGGLDGATVGMLYGALGSLMVGAATAFGYPAEQAAALNFSPEERAMLMEPTAKVLNKYTGALGKYEDEIMLAFALGSVIMPKVAGLKKPAQVIKLADRRPSTDPVSEPTE